MASAILNKVVNLGSGVLLSSFSVSLSVRVHAILYFVFFRFNSDGVIKLSLTGPATMCKRH